jgi:HK97 family phage prohead protease
MTTTTEAIRDSVARALSAEREVRSVPTGQLALRRDDAGGITLDGYASVFEVGYEMYGGPPYGWIEIVDSDAFSKTLREKPDVQLLVNHAGTPLARTKSGTLRLAADKTGLHTEAPLEPRSVIVQELALAMDRGDIDEMSFAFRTVRQEWNEDYTERRLLEVSIHRGDVSVVNYGANPATSAALRSAELLAGLAGLDPEAVLTELRSTGASDPLVALRAAHDVLTRALASATAPSTDPPKGISLDEARSLLEGITS